MAIGCFSDGYEATLPRGGLTANAHHARLHDKRGLASKLARLGSKKSKQPAPSALEAFKCPDSPSSDQAATASQSPGPTSPAHASTAMMTHENKAKDRKALQRKQAPPVTSSIIQQAGLNVLDDNDDSTVRPPNRQHKQRGTLSGPRAAPGTIAEPTISELLAQSGIEQDTLRAPPGIVVNKSSSNGGEGEQSITETQKVRYHEALDDIRQAMKW